MRGWGNTQKIGCKQICKREEMSWGSMWKKRGVRQYTKPLINHIGFRTRTSHTVHCLIMSKNSNWTYNFFVWWWIKLFFVALGLFSFLCLPYFHWECCIRNTRNWHLTVIFTVFEAISSTFNPWIVDHHVLIFSGNIGWVIFSKLILWKLKSH